MRYQFSKSKPTQGIAVVISFMAGVILQIVCAAITAVLIGKGTVPESMAGTTSLIIHGISAALVTIIAWVLSPEDPFVPAVSSVVGLVLLQVVAGLLFWDLELFAVLIRTLVAAVVFGSVLFLLTRTKKSGGVPKIKKRYG